MRRPFYALVAANALSLTGNVAAAVAVPWFVLTTTGSAAKTGLAAFCATIPFGVGALVGGAVSDRFGARGTSVVSDLAAGAAFAAIPLLHALGELRLWHILALAVVGGLFDGPAQAAREALLPELRERCGMSADRANALWTTTEHAGYVAGAPIAGATIAVAGAPAALWLDAGSFVLCALLVAVAVPRLGRLPDADFRPLAGLATIAANPTLRTFVVVWTLGNFLIAPLATVWLPVYAREELGGAAALGVLVTAYGVGGLAGAAAYGALAPRLSRRRLWTTVRVAYPIACVPLVFLPPLAAAALVLFLIGLIPGAGVPLYQAVLQENTPAALRGRVFATFRASLTLTAPVAMLAGGALVGAAGLHGTFVAYASSSALLSAFAWRAVSARL
jgi:MFS family permease